MAFYRPDPAMASHLESVLDQLDAAGRPGLRNSLSITWVRYSDVSPEAVSYTHLTLPTKVEV